MAVVVRYTPPMGTLGSMVELRSLSQMHFEEPIYPSTRHGPDLDLGSLEPLQVPLLRKALVELGKDGVMAVTLAVGTLDSITKLGTPVGLI